MSSTTSSTITSVITRLDSSPVRRRIMTPTPLVLATRQSSTEDEDRSTASSVRPHFVSSPMKSSHSTTRSPTHSKSSIRSERRNAELRRQVSEEYKTLMSIDVNHITSASNSSRVSGRQNDSTRRKSRDITDSKQTNGEINSEMSSSPVSPPKQCNRFGFFVDSDKAQDLP